MASPLEVLIMVITITILNLYSFPSLQTSMTFVIILKFIDYIKVGNLAWVKWKNHPFWPALVSVRYFLYL